MDQEEENAGAEAVHGTDQKCMEPSRMKVFSSSKLATSVAAIRMKNIVDAIRRFSHLHSNIYIAMHILVLEF